MFGCIYFSFELDVICYAICLVVDLTACCLGLFCCCCLIAAFVWWFGISCWVRCGVCVFISCLVLRVVL